MIKHEFICKLLSMYSYIQSKDEYGSYYDSYCRILTIKTDYDKLWNLFSQNFGKYPPTARELKEMAIKCYSEKYKNSCTVNNSFTIVADKNGTTYDFALEKSFEVSEKQLKAQGFSNIRMKNELQTSI